MTVLHSLNSRIPGSRADARADIQADAAAHRALKTSERCVIFIHGFANSPGAAERKYQKMMRSLSEVINGAHGQADDTAYFAFHWPGNHWLPVLDQFTFSTRVAAASSAGAKLAHWLYHRDNRPLGQIVLVAHSLGCRVALALLRESLTSPTIAQEPPLRIVHVALMAGAVRWQECAPAAGIFGASYPKTSYTNFYSYYDAVLTISFPVGQSLVDSFGRAIGRCGEPITGRWQRRVSTNLGHGGYWKSADVGQIVAIHAGWARNTGPVSAFVAEATFDEAGLAEQELESVSAVK